MSIDNIMDRMRNPGRKASPKKGSDTAAPSWKKTLYSAYKGTVLSIASLYMLLNPSGDASARNLAQANNLKISYKLPLAQADPAGIGGNLSQSYLPSQNHIASIHMPNERGCWPPINPPSENTSEYADNTDDQPQENTRSGRRKMNFNLPNLKELAKEYLKPLLGHSSKAASGSGQSLTDTSSLRVVFPDQPKTDAYSMLSDQVIGQLNIGIFQKEYNSGKVIILPPGMNDDGYIEAEPHYGNPNGETIKVKRIFIDIPSEDQLAKMLGQNGYSIFEYPIRPEQMEQAYSHLLGIRQNIPRTQKDSLDKVTDAMFGRVYDLGKDWGFPKRETKIRPKTKDELLTLRSIVNAASAKYGMNPRSMWDYMKQASDLNQFALTQEGEGGYFRLSPQMAKDMGLNVPRQDKLREDNFFPIEEKIDLWKYNVNPNRDERFSEHGRKNIEAGIRYLMLQDLVKDAADKHNVDPNMLWNHIRETSKFNQYALLPNGAGGYIPLTEQNGKDMGLFVHPGQTEITDKNYFLTKDKADLKKFGIRPDRDGRFSGNGAGNIDAGAKYIRLHNLVQKAAKKYDIDAGIIWNQIRTESGFNYWAVSPVGASGLMQFMPRTAEGEGLYVSKHKRVRPKNWVWTDTKEELKEHYGIDGDLDERFIPEIAIPKGVGYLKERFNTYNCMKLALAAYNLGEGNLNRRCRKKRGGPYLPFEKWIEKVPEETRNYVLDIYVMPKIKYDKSNI